MGVYLGTKAPRGFVVGRVFDALGTFPPIF
jgi:hypothetical protein